MSSFRFNGHRIAYREFGDGPRTCVLIHGLLLSQRMHEPLARGCSGEHDEFGLLEAFVVSGDSGYGSVLWG